MDAPYFWREVYFCSKNFLEISIEKKSHSGQDHGNRVNVLEHRPPVLTKNDVTLPALCLEALPCNKLIPQGLSSVNI